MVRGSWLDKDTYGLFFAKQDGDNIIVKADMGEVHIILRGSAERQKFLDYLDDTYGEDIGIEALYCFNRDKERGDGNCFTNNRSQQ